MQFDPDGDRDTLRELFGKDADSLSTDPVWVYVLERRRAVEVWNTLMGDEDPALARIHAPNSLRAVYGHSRVENAFIGSPDPFIAEQQIAVIFQSSPPFPSAEYADDIDPLTLSGSYSSPPRASQSGSLRSTSSRRSSLYHVGSDDGNGYFPHYANGETKGFKARPVPITNAIPESQPRMTRAAALRVGIVSVEERERGARQVRTKEEMKQSFMDVPGHKRSETIQVASTAPPVVAPRATRASMLRENKEVLSKTPTWGKAPPKTPTQAARPKATINRSGSSGNLFEGVPGHKRRESMPVASIAPPVIAPRQNKSAALRAQKDAAAPPSSFMFRGASATQTPTLSSRSSFDASTDGGPPRRPPSRSNSSSSLATKATAAAKPPDIAPRTNKSALLRAKSGTPTPGSKRS